MYGKEPQYNEPISLVPWRFDSLNRGSTVTEQIAKDFGKKLGRELFGYTVGLLLCFFLKRLLEELAATKLLKKNCVNRSHKEWA